MAARGHMPSVFESHSVQATSSLRHDPAPAFSQHLIIKHKIAMQRTEIEKLVLENERLAASHGSLRHELVATQQEVQKIQGYTLESQTENEFETKGLQERISKMEADIQAGENLKKELREANLEAKGLLASKVELDTEVQKLTADLQKAYDELKSFPPMHRELESLLQEHQILQASFKYKKGLNVEQVEQMKGMDRNLMTMARELEKLREEVAKIEQGKFKFANMNFSTSLFPYISLSCALVPNFLQLGSSFTYLLHAISIASNPYGGAYAPVSEAYSHGGQGVLLGSYGYRDRYRRPQV